MNLVDYFQDDAIIRMLCKQRLKHAKKRHKIHLIRDVSLNPTTNRIATSQLCPSELAELFPSRRNWYRLKEKERKMYSNSQKLQLVALERTIYLTKKNATQGKSKPIWLIKLETFVEQIKAEIESGNIIFEKPEIFAIKKEDKKDTTSYRPISNYSLRDRIIIGLTARYLTDFFDNLFQDCSLAFRSVKNKPVKTHHDAIELICKYRGNRTKGNIYVAECDIKKFYDCVSHKMTLSVFNELVSMQVANGKEFDKRAFNVFSAYLHSYSFKDDVYILNQDVQYWKAKNILSGVFEWPEKEMRKMHGDRFESERIGVPQGGALSCLISNLLLHSVDLKVLEANDGNLLYIRYCDDMILLHSSERACHEALQRYKEQIELNLLSIHDPVQVKRYDSHFWKTKSKEPFLWSSPSEGGIPWLSFVGYQIRYDGLIRIRQKSIKKELKKQKDETNTILKAIQSSKDDLLVKFSRKSKRQQVFALENRLISMSVGRVKVFNYKEYLPSYCWTNGFKKVNRNRILIKQLRLLDRSREKQIKRFLGKLMNLNKDADTPDDPKITSNFFGNPYSYNGLISSPIIKKKK